MSEQLALEQVTRDRGAIQFRARLVCPGAIEVDHAPHILFPCPGFALEKNGHPIVLCEFADLLQEQLCDGAFCNDAIDGIAVHILAAVQLDLSAQREQIRGSAQRMLEIVHADGFGDKIEGAEPHRFDRILHRASGGQHDHREIRCRLFHLGEHVQA